MDFKIVIIYSNKRPCMWDLTMVGPQLLTMYLRSSTSGPLGRTSKHTMFKQTNYTPEDAVLIHV